MSASVNLAPPNSISVDLPDASVVDTFTAPSDRLTWAWPPSLDSADSITFSAAFSLAASCTLPQAPKASAMVIPNATR